MIIAPHARARSLRQIAFAVETKRSSAAFVSTSSTASPAAVRANTNATAGSRATSSTNIFFYTDTLADARRRSSDTAGASRSAFRASVFFRLVT
jgi:hypothetical protein